MDSSVLTAYKDWFSAYTGRFHFERPEEQRNIDLKVDHTRHVCEVIVEIARSQGLSPEEVRLAETVGLFHDLGRFEQYARYKTFRDSISVNHGRLGADILESESVLGDLAADEREIVSRSVLFHNAFAIPEPRDDRSTLFLRLIRDADKLDIWRVFLGYLEGEPSEMPSEALLGLPNLDTCSPEVTACLTQGRMAALTALKSVNDFILLQISWAYDLNFRKSFLLALERRYVERLGGLLPDTAEVRAACDAVSGFVQRRAAAG